MLRIVAMLLDYVWPKDKRVVIFGSYGGQFAGGNSKPVFEYLRNNEPELRCYFLLREKVDKPGYLHFKPFSLRTLHILLRAKTLVLTHTLWDLVYFRPSRRKFIFRLWHGHSGPKADGYVSKRFTRENLIDIERNASRITKFLATSRINLYFWAYALLLHPRQLMPLGFPRNDILLREDRDTKLLGSLIGELPDDAKVVLYAPTYRTYGETRFFPFDDFVEDKLRDWLDKHNVVLLLRYHMVDRAPIEESDRIRAFNFNLCPEVNEVLPEVDVLVTDYSSIASDYMLLDRPIIYVAYDKDLFEKYEGFCFGNYEFWTPGPKVLTLHEFLNELELAIAGQDRFQERRRTVNQLINEYQTPDSTKQVAEYIVKFLSQKRNPYDRDPI